MARTCDKPGPSRGMNPSVPRGFTIIELLVVVAIIIILMSLILVAMNAAGKSAQQARSGALMDSMKKALIRFKEDIGYYPPVLGVNYTTGGPPGGSPTPAELRKLFPNSVPHPDATYGGGNYTDHMQEYYSTCTLGDYLIGYGHHYQDGHGETGEGHPFDWSCSPNAGGVPVPCESPAAGIRHPGDDGVWGASINMSAQGLLTERMRMGTQRGSETAPLPIDQGKVYGPYLELDDERLLAGVRYGPNGLEVYFPGDTLPAGVTFNDLPKAIVDYWGNPIRYYRRPYPTGALNQSYRAIDRNGDGTVDRVPTLSDVFVLRPWSIEPGEESTGLADASGNTTTTRQLDAAEFALFSAGADKASNNDVTVDEPGVPGNTGPNPTQQSNKDNIVVLGP